MIMLLVQVLRKPLHMPVRPARNSGSDAELEVVPVGHDEQSQEDVKMAFYKIIEAFRVRLLTPRYFTAYCLL
jgi:hypothetical protein